MIKDRLFRILMLGLISIFFVQGAKSQVKDVPSIITTGTFRGIVGPIRDLQPDKTMEELEAGRIVDKEKLKQLMFERNVAMKERNYPFLETALPDGPDPVWQNKMSGAKATPVIDKNFAGQNSTMFPPDCNGAVGPNHFVQTINVSYTIYDKNGNLVKGPLNMNTLFNGVTGSNCNDGDPIILYDEMADRWFASEFSLCGSNDLMLMAVSTTNDPTGTWYAYSFDVDDMPDYMKYGIWNDGYYMATNNTTGDDVYVFERSVMLAGGVNPKMIGFNNSNRPNSGFHCIMPLDNDWSYAPANTPGLFITINDDAWGGSDQLWIYELNANWTTPANSTFSRVQTLTVPAFDSYFGSNWNDIAQPGTTQKLDGIPQILMFRAQYINFGGTETIVCNHTVDVDNTAHAGIRWYELTRTGASFAVRQSGTYAPDANSRWCAGISMNQNHEIGLAYSITGSSTGVYPGIRFTGQSAAENALASGVMDITETEIKAGTGSQTGANRWGDYAQMSVDPADNSTFWFTTEYGKGGSSKGTQIAAFRFGDLGNPTLTANAVSGTEIDLSWVKNSSNDPVLLVWSATGTFGTPTNGTTYSAGNTIPGGGTVLYYGPNTAYNHTGLTPATTYYYKAYSYKTAVSQYSPGVTAQATTYCCDAFTMDFEACTDYSTNFLPWTSVDGDGITTYGSSDFDFPGENTAFAFMAMNPTAAALAAPIATANGGLRCGMAISPSDASAADDWFISDLVSLGNGSSFSFYALTVKDNWGLEDFEVLVSTTNNSTSSFNVISGGASQQAPNTWTLMNYDLSAYDNQDVYVAIHYFSTDKFMFFIDDLVISTNTTSNPPVANFSASTTSTCSGNSVTFTDLSTESPTAWNWAFEGGTPATSTLQNPTVTYATAGTYNVQLTVTNVAGSNTKTSTNYISVTATPSVNLGADRDICQGQTVTLDAGINSATYNWSTGATSKTITVGTSGTYTVTVTKSGCAGTDEAVVNVHSLPVVNLGNDVSVCQGDIVTLDAQNTGSTYQWSNSATTQTISPTTNGTYTVSVTDVYGCSSSDQAVVTFNTNPTVNIGPDQSACVGSGITFNAQNAGSSYLWNNGATTQTINVTAAGTYSVVVTDVNSCTGSSSAVASYNPLPIVNLGADQSTCIGATVTLNAQNPGASYVWSTGATTQTINVTTNGTYSVDVTDANGCIGSDAAIITFGAGLVVDLGGNQQVCQGSSLTLNAQNPGANYSWSTGATTQTINVSTAGSYSVVVTDLNGCTGSDASTISMNSLPVVTLGADITDCEGANYILDAQNSGSSYLWSTGATSQTINVTASGNYSVDVTDGNNCTGTDVINVTINPNPIVDLGGDQSACDGTSITLDALNTGASYIWSTGATTQTINIIAADAYSVTVTSNNCSGTDVANIGFNSLPVVSISATDESVNGACDGSLTANITGGITPYSYSWDNSGPAVTTYGPGTVGTLPISSTVVFDLPVTGLGNLDGTSLYIESICLDITHPRLSRITNISLISPSGTSVQLTGGIGGNNDNYTGTCFSMSGADGAIVDATAPYTGSFVPMGSFADYYNGQNSNGTWQLSITCSATAGDLNSWEITFASGEATNINSNLCAGTYGLTVTDANGCIGNSSGTVAAGINIPPVADFTSDNTSICEGSSVNFIDNSINVPTSWNWTFEGGTPASSTDQNPTGIIYNANGSYNVTLSVSNIDGTDVITMNNYITVNPVYSTTTTADICDGDSIFLDGNWQFTAGVYPTSYFSVSGCDSIVETTLSVLPAPVIELGSDTILCANENILLNAGSGTDYLWSNGETTQTILVDSTNIGIGSANYAVTITEGTCSDIASVQVSFTVCSGIQDSYEGISMRIYPNPAEDIFTIDAEMDSKVDIIYVEFVDLLGKTISRHKQRNSGSFKRTFSTETLSKGVYFVRLTAGDKSVTEKLIIQ